MQTDRELLEAAARAAGFGYGEWVKGGIVFAAVDALWNPLADDGDALRLAVKLRLPVDWCPLDGGHEFATCHFGDGDEMWEPIENGDDNAATRRAVVRAAAAMAQEGKA